MKKRNNIKLFIIVLILQIVLIAYLIGKIHKKSSALGVYKINPINKDSFPLSAKSDLKVFFEPVPNKTDRQEVSGIPGKMASYTINSDSLNERYDYKMANNESKYRIITLGDSFTFGMFVDTKNNYPEQLEDKLNNFGCASGKKFDVINLGVIDYDIQASVERYRLRGQKYNPELLVWLLKDDDFLQVNELNFLEVGRLINEGYEKSFKEGKEKLTTDEKAIENTFKIYGEEKILNMQKKFLPLIRKYYKNKILFVVMTDNSKYTNIVNDFVKKDENSIIYDTFTLYDDNLRFIDKHPNEKGYSIFSDELFTYLREKKIIPCD